MRHARVVNDYQLLLDRLAGQEVMIFACEVLWFATDVGEQGHVVAQQHFRPAGVGSQSKPFEASG